MTLLTPLGSLVSTQFLAIVTLYLQCFAVIHQMVYREFAASEKKVQR